MFTVRSVPDGCFKEYVERPGRAVVVGGFIGLEMAENKTLGIINNNEPQAGALLLTTIWLFSCITLRIRWNWSISVVSFIQKMAQSQGKPQKWQRNSNRYGDYVS